MLRRVSSSFFGLIRTPSTTEVPSFIRSPNQDNATPQSEPKSSTSSSNTDLPADIGEIEITPIVAVPTEPIIVDTEERDAFIQTLEICHPVLDASQDGLVDLPYTFDENLVITFDGVLRAHVNMGLVGGETNFHVGLRRQPSVAGRITRLELIMQAQTTSTDAAGQRDASVATQQEGLLEWARTVPAMKNLTSFKLSHLATGGESGAIYVPLEAKSEDDGGHIDASTLIKSLAWFFHEKMVEVTLEGVDCSDNATRAWEGAKVQKLTMNACTARVASIIPRLPCLRDFAVVENGELSAGCDYLGLLSHVKPNLKCISITLMDTRIDVDAFVNTFKGVSALVAIQCPFTSTPPLSPEQIERKLRAAFPTYNPSESERTQTSTETLDVEMGVLEPSTSHNKGSSSRTSTIERKKEELKTAEGAKKEKGRILSTIRKLKAAAARR
ncbi:hypothetical protein FRB96_001820 [Tulasnella sp. 330]|nr:hypothetical protein FRB96_001820 [Tulasnella sp. 330]KAG8885188.1 hypothetical protein FRB97_002006 [Tulasnella sp. 331]